MSQNHSSSDWAAARGEKWRDEYSRMEAMLAPVDEPLLDALRLDVACRIADIGCGGAGTTLEIARRAATGSVVRGFDISPALIEVARVRAHSVGHSVTFEVADVSTAPAPMEPYDLLVSRFGTMFFDDPLSAFSNLRGWLAPGGRFAFAAWGHPAENPWRTLVYDVVAGHIDVPQADPDGPGPFRYANASTLLALLDRAGFRDVAVREWRGSLPMGGGLPAGEAAEFALTALSSYGELLAEAGGDRLEQTRADLTARYAEHEQDGAVRLAASVHIVTGSVPMARR